MMKNAHNPGFIEEEKGGKNENVSLKNIIAPWKFF